METRSTSPTPTESFPSGFLSCFWVLVSSFLDLGLSIAFCAASDNFCALFLGSPGTRDHTGVETGRTRDMNVSRLTVSTACPPPLYILVGHIYFFSEGCSKLWYPNGSIFLFWGSFPNILGSSTFSDLPLLVNTAFPGEVVMLLSICAITFAPFV